nr:PREDICTED: uncharacterized protein LOC109042982 isoform X2 [Bemisia tabaci]
MAQGNILFREIHKNAWLKRLPPPDKKLVSHLKKGERVWTVFCVHNDKEPLLELYNDQKEAGAHKPEAVIQLSPVLHISPTLCATEDEFEFVITLPSEVIRFTAPTWDQMMEWVDSMCSKLREMRILSPKENLYSKMPEQRPLLLPTRDPNSPLPLPPAGPSSVVLGVEPVPVTLPDQSDSAIITDSSSSGDRTNPSNLPNGVSELVMNHSSPIFDTASSSRALQRLCSPSRTTAASPFTVKLGSPQPTVSNPSSSSIPPHTNPSSSNSDHISSISNVSNCSDSNRHRSNNVNNVTVIEVSSSDASSQLLSSGVFDFSFVNESLPANAENEEFFTPPGTPVLPRSVARFISNSLSGIKQSQPSNSQQVGSVVAVDYPSASSGHSEYKTNSEVNQPLSIDGCETMVNAVTATVSPVTSSSTSAVSVLVPSQALSPPPCSSPSIASVPFSSENNSSDSNVYEHLFLSTNQTPQSPSQLDPMPQSPTINEDIVTPIVATPLISNIHGPVSRGRGNMRSRRRGSHPEVSSPIAADRIRIVPSHRLQPAPRPVRQPMSVEPSGPSRLTLREQQVMQLRREMLHPGGVRLQVRRKDCLGPIAFVDAFNAVWVAGWKQKEHPMLYNVLHIGDQIMSVAGVQLHSAADTLKVIKGVQSLYIEFVIRRVPCGRIYAIRREREGQSLGIVQEGTAEIREVIPGSLAAMQGLSSRTPTMDGLSLTSWVLTEINGRPLNLFFKENEVRDRLNAVGLDISILVQPFDLVKQIKKQLKTIRSYKDFIVQ